jgi:peptidoglycan-associated lipoprotein
MKKFWLVAFGLVVAFGLADCAKKPALKPGSNTSQSVPATGASTGGAAGGAAGEARPLPGMSVGPSASEAGTTLATVYFAFDSAEIASEYNAPISAAARKLSQSAGLKLRLEGNTDERGSPEYNIGLGERRSQAVKRALALAGAPDAQLLTVSYGAERPAAEGHDETAWAKNRRVDIVVLGGTP